MNTRLLLLGLLVLVLLGASAYALQPKAVEEPAPTSEQTTEQQTPVDTVEEAPLPPDPVFAISGNTETVALKAALPAPTATLQVEGTSFPIRVPEGATIEEAMKALEAEGALSYKARVYTGLGTFVEEIQGKASTSEYYWILHVNGKKSATGISQTRISSGDVIEWKYEKKY